MLYYYYWNWVVNSPYGSPVISIPRAATSVQMRKLTSPSYKINPQTRNEKILISSGNLIEFPAILTLNLCRFAFLSMGLRSLWRQTQLNCPWALVGPPPKEMKNCSRLSQSNLVRQKMRARSIFCCSMARTTYLPLSNLMASESNSERHKKWTVEW